MSLGQAFEVVSILVAVTALLRGVRNTSKAWDHLVDSVERLNEKMGKVIEENEKEHRDFRKEIRNMKNGKNEGN